MPCDVAVGTSPSDATSMVIRIGRNRKTAPSWTASRTESPRAVQHGHQNRAEPQTRTLVDRIQDRKPARAQLIDVLQHDHARLHGDSKEREESNPGRNAEIRSGQVER